MAPQSTGQRRDFFIDGTQSNVYTIWEKIKTNLFITPYEINSKQILDLQ